MAKDTNKKGIVYYLSKIFDAVSALGGSVITAQSDWDEADETSPKYIQNKPEIPTLKVITVSSVATLTADQLEALEAGDTVIKSDESGKHAYVVSYKSATGLCLTYTDCENVETVAYEKADDVWSYDSTDITHIGS